VEEEMNIAVLENTMYQVSNLFLLPVLLAIIGLFLYAFYVLGGFVAQYRQRRQGRKTLEQMASTKILEKLKGYPLVSHAALHPDESLRDHELRALKLLEPIRIITRVAPMLGLVATMIPMGPALRALANGNVQGISENLIVAFTAVIFGLITASITFWIASVRKQWLLDELHIIEALREPVPNDQCATKRAGKKDPEDVVEEVDEETRYAVA
jgi:biopolymer transport protein ExbB/TolQ